MTYYSSVILITLLALAVLSILVAENNRIPYSKKRLFIATNLLIAISAIAECSGIHLNGHTELPRWVLPAVKAVDYTLTPMTGGAMILLMQKPNTKHRLLTGIFIGNALLQFVSVFFGWMIVLDDQNRYSHGPVYPVYIALYCFVILLVAIRMLSYGKSFRRQNRGSLYATILLVFIGIGMQELLGNDFRVAYLATAFGSAFLFIHYSEFSQLRLDDEISQQQVQLSVDALTGVFSRFAYVEALRNYADAIPDSLSVFLIDINGLKAVNDSIGHEAGDELICGAAGCIQTAMGEAGKVFRIGGDEFVVLASMTREQAETALNNLNQETGRWHGKQVHSLSLSTGYVRAEELKGLSVEELVKEADKAMYAQKKDYYHHSGRDRRRAPTVSP